MAGRFIDVVVSGHDDLPDGCRLRFQALADPRPVRLIRYTPLVGTPGVFRVEAHASGSASGPAQAASVENVGRATSTLIWGGNLGLRLFREPPDARNVPVPGTRATTPSRIAEPYLLLSAEDIIS